MTTTTTADTSMLLLSEMMARNFTASPRASDRSPFDDLQDDLQDDHHDADHHDDHNADYHTDWELSRVHQFHGKWPFYRVWGVQEPASVLFSVGNLVANGHAWWRTRTSVPTSYRPYRRYLLWYSVVNMHAWLWSALFHTRDLPFTERMDYFSAAAVILYGLWFAGYRWVHQGDGGVVGHDGARRGQRCEGGQGKE